MEMFALITLFILAFAGGWATHEMIGEFRGYYDPQELRLSREETMRYARREQRAIDAAKRLKESHVRAEAALNAYRATFGEVTSLEDRYAS